MVGNRKHNTLLIVAVTVLVLAGCFFLRSNIRAAFALSIGALLSNISSLTSRLNWKVWTFILEALCFLLIAFTLPGIWAIITIHGAIQLSTLQYTPTQVRPRLIKHHHLSPYLGYALIFFKSLLVLLELDFSEVSIDGISTMFKGLFLIGYTIILLFQFIASRNDLYQGLLKEMAEKEKNWTLELMSLLSHNIRTPVSTISNQIEILKMKHAQEIAITSEDINRLEKYNTNVSLIINQLLNNTARTQIRNKGGAVSLETVLEMLNLSEIIVENEKGVDFNLSTTNAIALQLCLESLISNSVKYGSTQTRVLIHSSATDFKIKVIDNGQGMSPLQIKNYGTPFNTNESAGGTGLGVYLTLQLLKEKGWDWSLESELNLGTQASLILPRNKLII